jgi:hypothetical protein
MDGRESPSGTMLHSKVIGDPSGRPLPLVAVEVQRWLSLVFAAFRLTALTSKIRAWRNMDGFCLRAA